MRVGSNGSIPEFIESLAEAIEEAVTENQYATGCEIPEEPYVGNETYAPGSLSERLGFDHSSLLQSNLLKTVGRAIESGRNEKLAGLATQGNATDYLMAATGQGGTTYNGVGGFTGNFMGMGGQITPEKFEQDFNAGKTIVVATPKDQGGMFAGLGSAALKDQYGLESGQCYTVKRAYTDERGQKMAELSDPTGKSQPRPIPLNNMPGYQVAVG
ncbi:hypothetical protein L0244_39365 [bacterium]|nr:hypothetical protein [bacterium]